MILHLFSDGFLGENSTTFEVVGPLPHLWLDLDRFNLTLIPMSVAPVVGSVQLHWIWVEYRSWNLIYPPWNELPKHLKMDGWNTSFLLGWPIFRCNVSFRECKYWKWPFGKDVSSELWPSFCIYVEFQRDISIIYVDVFLRTYAGHLNVSMYIMYFLAAVNPSKTNRMYITKYFSRVPQRGSIYRNVTKKNRSFQDLVHLSLLLESLDVAVLI